MLTCAHTTFMGDVQHCLMRAIPITGQVMSSARRPPAEVFVENDRRIASAGLHRIEGSRFGQYDCKHRTPDVATCAGELAPAALSTPQRIAGRRGVCDSHAIEADVAEGHEPFEWMLLTSVPTSTREETLERLEWCARRWTIESWHRVRKSGCRVEARQSGDLDDSGAPPRYLP